MTADNEKHTRPGLSRRAFLVASTGGAALAAEAGLSPAARLARIASSSPTDLSMPMGTTGGPLPTFSRRVRRYSDGLNLLFQFHNLEINQATSPPNLQRIIAGEPCFVVVTFPAQSFAEEFIRVEGADPIDPDDFVTKDRGQYRSRLSRQSRIALKLKSGQTTYPFDLDELLRFENMDLSVVPHARVAGATTGPDLINRSPEVTQTSIEMPWRLVLSPSKEARFSHSTTAVTHNDRTEVWHTRIGREGATTQTEIANRGVRAVWLVDGASGKFADWVDGTSVPPGPGMITDGQPFNMSLTPMDRFQLVRVSTGWSIPGHIPPMIKTERLALSMLGGFLEVDQTFPDTPGTDILAWQHRMTLGRDHYARVVYKGYLLPWGHEAELVTIAERQFAEDGDGETGAYGFLKSFIIVRRPNESFDSRYYPQTQRNLPFRSVTMKTRVTPFFTPQQLGDLSTSQVIVPFIAGAPFRWRAVGNDWDGNQIQMAMPMAFVLADVAEDLSDMNTVRGRWNSSVYKEVDTSGQRIAFAESRDPGDTALDTTAIRVQLDPSTKPELTHKFVPKVSLMTVRLGPAEEISGSSIGDRNLLYNGEYLFSGFAAAGNAGEMWANVSGGAVNLAYDPERAGAVIVPNTKVKGLSRKLGVVGGDLNAVRNGSFDPFQFFDGDTPKLLGGLSLASIIQPTGLGPIGAPAPPEAPRVNHRELAGGTETRLDWQPRLKQDDDGIFRPDDTHGRVEVVVFRPDDDSPATTTVTGELTGFGVRLPNEDNGLLEIPFSRLAFESRNGHAPELDVSVLADEVQFFDELEFIEAIRRYLSFGGGNAPYVKVVGAAIEAGVGFELPDVKLGVFTLSNIDFSATFTLPLLDEPATVRFALAKREDPFRLTVFGLGGGGYVAITAALDGVKAFEMALEAAAEVCLDLGPISAGLSCSVGIYLSVAIESGVEKATFGGYFRIRGEVDCAIASASIELYMALEYNKVGDTAYVIGRASLTIEVTVLFISGTIEVEVERRFKASKNDPPFELFMPSTDHWADYCGAFAPIVRETA